jgi:hypothetical protein
VLASGEPGILRKSGLWTLVFVVILLWFPVSVMMTDVSLLRLEGGSMQIERQRQQAMSPQKRTTLNTPMKMYLSVNEKFFQPEE